MIKRFVSCTPLVYILNDSNVEDFHNNWINSNWLSSAPNYIWNNGAQIVVEENEQKEKRGLEIDNFRWFYTYNFIYTLHLFTLNA